MPMTVDRGKCITCGYCVTNCPVKAITIQNGKAFISRELCSDCWLCVGKCLMQAICPEEKSG